MFGLGVGEILIILAFALIFIGPKKLPGLARSLGKSLREFQHAKDDLLSQVDPDQFRQDFSSDKDDDIIVGVDESGSQSESEDSEEESSQKESKE